jgi:4-amino-4-deoxy-L-arabinose transferase-like glycosyltransferase
VGAVTVVLTAYLGRSLAGVRVGLVAAIVVALSPFMIAADGSLMAESLFIALTTAAVLAAVRARRTGGPAWFVLVGLLLGLATLTRSDGLIVALVLVPVAAWCSGGAVLRRVGVAALALAVAVGVLVPWVVRNSDALGETTLLSNNSGSLISGANCDATYRGGQLAGWEVTCVPLPEGVTEVERTAEQRRAGIDYAKEHWLRAGLVAPLRVVRGWGLWSPGALLDAEVVESRTRPMQTVGWVASLALLGLAAWGTVVMVRDRKEVALLLAMVGAATLILMTSWGNQRFRLVAEPELAVLAAAALAQAWTRLERSRHARPVPERVSVPRTSDA